MWWTALIRFLRRRIILGLILTISLTYCIFSYVGRSDLDDDDSSPPRRTQPFRWRTLQQHDSNSNQNNHNNSAMGAELTNCRNSIQGRVLIVDDRGFVCPRHDIQLNGCCGDSGPQYLCDTCGPNNCCTIYEYCISCCLHPDKKDMLEQVLGTATRQNNVIFAAVSDHYELCLAKCRTNSQSVQHENSYKDPKAKHCFGELGPGTNANEI